DGGAAVGERAVTELQCYQGGVGSDDVARAVFDGDGDGGTDRDAGDGLRRLLRECEPSAGGDREGAGRGTGQQAVGGGQGVGACGADEQVGEGSDAAGHLGGHGGAAANERAAVERQRHGGGTVGGEDIVELVLGRDL